MAEKQYDAYQTSLMQKLSMTSERERERSRKKNREKYSRKRRSLELEQNHGMVELEGVQWLQREK